MKGWEKIYLSERERLMVSAYVKAHLVALGHLN